MKAPRPFWVIQNNYKIDHMKFVSRYISSLIIALLLMSQPVLAKRYALLIGNSNYAIGSLTNPVNDAKDMAELLKAKQFEVKVLFDADQRTMESAINEFTHQLAEQDAVGLFYYAGHGVEVDGRNYLVPVDAEVASETDVKYEAVDAGRVLDGMGRAGNNLNLVILDACRNNPYSRSFRTATRGLARMDAAKGSLVLYATSPGDVAMDGEGRNGVFTAFLMDAIKMPDLSVEKVFKKTANDVYKHTDGKQLPWQTGVILGEFYFTKTPVPEKKLFPPNVIPKLGRQEEILFWDSIKHETNSAYFESYLNKYPEGVYVDLARLKIEDKQQPIIENRAILAHLTINTSPPDARVRILNIAPKFRQGMELKPGRYHLEVSKVGFQKHLEWIDISNDLTHQIKLTKAPEQPVKLPKPISGKIPGYVALPGGCFQMGSPKQERGRDSDEKLHKVCVNSFFMASKEVTVGEFRRFVKATGYRTDAERKHKKSGCYSFNQTSKQWNWQQNIFWDHTGYQQNDSNPVTCVSWNDTQAYIKWFNRGKRGHYRLPTEAEWEYAARGGSSKPFFWLDNKMASACQYGNVADKGHRWQRSFGCNDGYRYTAPVGHYQPNPFGLYDMLGNVSEWTCSKASRSYSGNETQCLRNTQSKYTLIQYRGGSFYDIPKWLRVANRNKLEPWERNYFLGFRLVRER